MMQGWLAPIVRIREGPGETDQDGELIPGSGTVERSPLPGGLFSPGGSVLDVSRDNNAVTSTPAVYWPGLERVDVVSTDRLEIGGTVWYPQGMPAVWPKGVSLQLKAVEARTGGQ